MVHDFGNDFGNIESIFEDLFLCNNGCARGDSEVQLDEECAKVFAMDSGVSTVYDFPDTEVHRLPKFDEKDYQRKYYLLKKLRQHGGDTDVH
ncbi:hypothetical protein GWI33_022126 [Rhynchophorus ferrugineus]|uniref:Uncharacterized protein n=1 Tax=Rhynchophorus ferrugineus TaxID=354439 RepID=A0A834HPZ4_RHYFE|nr:hypothetical protein GWI33_022126 [Rhynchophorus ferrugineus]